MPANDKQVGGTHYKTGDLNHWDIVNLFGLGYFEGQATKYLFRWRKKGGIQDLEKAIHYIEKLIEIEKAKLAPSEVLNEEFKRACEGPRIEGGDSKNKDRIDRIISATRAHISVPNMSAPVPKSNEYYTYEGGTREKELYTCKRCKAKFETPLGEDPTAYHYHPPKTAGEEPEATGRYTNQD